MKKKRILLITLIAILGFLFGLGLLKFVIKSKKIDQVETVITNNN